METVLIVVHLMIVLAMIGFILMQRSEGGALGIGGGGNSFMSARGVGNFLSQTTTILAIVFFATSLALSILANFQTKSSSVLDAAPAASSSETVPAESKTILDQLNEAEEGAKVPTPD